MEGGKMEVLEAIESGSSNNDMGVVYKIELVVVGTRKDVGLRVRG
jgi:hypothetical protein